MSNIKRKIFFCITFFCILIAVTPFITSAINNQPDGFMVSPGETKDIGPYFDIRLRVKNNSSIPYFVPTSTEEEFSRFSYETSVDLIPELEVINIASVNSLAIDIVPAVSSEAPAWPYVTVNKQVIKYSWSANNATSFYYSLDSGATWDSIDEYSDFLKNPLSPSGTISGAAPSVGTYNVKVRACNFINDCEESEVVTFYVEALPSNVLLSINRNKITVGDSSVLISYSGSATNYFNYRTSQDGKTYSPYIYLASGSSGTWGSGQTWADVATYNIQVQACNKAKDCTASTVVALTVLERPTCSLWWNPTSAIVPPGTSSIYWSSKGAAAAKYSCWGVFSGSGPYGSLPLPSGSVPFTLPAGGTETCQVTVKNNADIPYESSCSASISACMITSWSPPQDTVCDTVKSFLQTSNCGTTRYVPGTKCCPSYTTDSCWQNGVCGYFSAAELGGNCGVSVNCGGCSKSCDSCINHYCTNTPVNGTWSCSAWSSCQMYGNCGPGTMTRSCTCSATCGGTCGPQPSTSTSCYLGCPASYICQ